MGAATLAGQEDGRGRAPQLDTPLQPGDTVSATPFGRYRASAIHRWVMGDGYRDLWALPVPAPVLDLETFAGGLELEDLGGGQQTRSLVFRGGDGQEWRFRSIDKDAARTLDPELRRTIAARVLQDQIAHLFPLSATVVDRILEAADVLHATPTLVVLPDDPALGEHREAFRGMLGWMEVRPDEGDGERGFAGSGLVVGSERMLERIEEEPDNRIDAEAYLRARLVDAYVGDWDRHPDQWRWAAFADGEGLLFRPVPRDRDWALSRLDGFVTRLAWIPWPNYVGFRSEYPPAFRLMWSGRALDRRLLSGLERDAWDRVVADLGERLTDEVIDEAVARLPDSYGAARDDLRSALRVRRDALPGFAREFYGLLAGWVDVHTTDADEVAEVRWLDRERVRVEVRLAEPGSLPPTVYERTFVVGETQEIRLYLHGGDDRAELEGEGDGELTVRIVGGGGDDVVVDRSAGPVVVHDDRGDNRVDRGPRTRVDTGAWEEPVDPDDNTHRARHRDWGSRTLVLPIVSYDSDLGISAGATLTRTGYGFRHHPFESRLAVTARIASETGRPDLRAEADLPVPGRRSLRARVRALAPAAEFHRFYGFGNGTDADHERAEAAREILGLESALAWRALPGLTLSAGASVWAHRPLDQDGSLVSTLQPYGAGRFEELRLDAGLVATAGAEAPWREGAGLRVEADAHLVPGLLDVTDRYTSVGGRVEGFWASGEGAFLRPALSARVGARSVGGTAPYFAAAYVGGEGTLRGFRKERFAGEEAVWAGLEARLFLTEFVFVLPGDLGITGLCDVGRVFLDEDDADRWHGACGGGLWTSFVDTFTGSVSFARGEDETLVYVTFGLPF